jgi:hypothetical protein
MYVCEVYDKYQITLNEYNNPSFATMFERALLNTYITTCFAINVVYTYFNSIDFNNRQKFLTQIQQIR